MSELPHGAKTYYVVGDSRTVKQYSVVAGKRVACSSCRSVECKHAKYVASIRPATPAQRSALSGQWIAEWDAMVAKRRSGGSGSAPADTTPAPGSGDGPPAAPKRKRRTKLEMQEFRAAKQRQIETSYRELVPASTRAWLDEEDPLLRQILEAPHDA